MEDRSEFLKIRNKLEDFDAASKYLWNKELAWGRLEEKSSVDQKSKYRKIILFIFLLLLFGSFYKEITNDKRSFSISSIQSKTTNKSNFYKYKKSNKNLEIPAVNPTEEKIKKLNQDLNKGTFKSTITGRKEINILKDTLKMNFISKNYSNVTYNSSPDTLNNIFASSSEVDSIPKINSNMVHNTYKESLNNTLVNSIVDNSNSNDVALKKYVNVNKNNKTKDLKSVKTNRQKRVKKISYTKVKNNKPGKFSQNKSRSKRMSRQRR